MADVSESQRPEESALFLHYALHKASSQTCSLGRRPAVVVQPQFLVLVSKRAKQSKAKQSLSFCCRVRLFHTVHDSPDITFAGPIISPLRIAFSSPFTLRPGSLHQIHTRPRRVSLQHCIGRCVRASEQAPWYDTSNGGRNKRR